MHSPGADATALVRRVSRAGELRGARGGRVQGVIRRCVTTVPPADVSHQHRSILCVDLDRVTTPTRAGLRRRRWPRPRHAAHIAALAPS